MDDKGFSVLGQKIGAFRLELMALTDLDEYTHPSFKFINISFQASYLLNLNV